MNTVIAIASGLTLYAVIVGFLIAVVKGGTAK